jgi:hypothetical protein
MTEASEGLMSPTPDEILTIYQNVLDYARDRDVSANVITLLRSGLGFSDAYELFVRDTGNRLPVEMSTTYAPSLQMAGLDLTRLVDNAEEGRPSQPDIAKKGGVQGIQNWYVGSRGVIPYIKDAIGFVGRNKHGIETVLNTSPQNIVLATSAALDRGIVSIK